MLVAVIFPVVVILPFVIAVFDVLLPTTSEVVIVVLAGKSMYNDCPEDVIVAFNSVPGDDTPNANEDVCTCT